MLCTNSKRKIQKAIQTFIQFSIKSQQIASLQFLKVSLLGWRKTARMGKYNRFVEDSKNGNIDISVSRKRQDENWMNDTKSASDRIVK